MAMTENINGALAHSGYKRGCYKLTVNNLSKLPKNVVFESNPFEIGGFKWRLNVWRGNRNGVPPEMLRVLLLSCNPEGVYADISFMAVNQNEAGMSALQRKSKVGLPFNYIDRLYVPIDELMDREGRENCSVVIMADLKNIRIATDAEQRPLKSYSRTCVVEVISRESINKRLNGRSSLTIVPPSPERYCDVSTCSLVRPWAQQSPDYRYWLCKRCGDGNVKVGECLNEADTLKRFEDICDDSGGGYPWVSVFREEKKSHAVFQPIEHDTIVVFCMLCDESLEELEYLGYVLVPSSMSCHTLVKRIAHDMELGQTYQHYEMHLNEVCIGSSHISRKSLDECGMLSGSIVVMKSALAGGSDASGESVDLCGLASDVEHLGVVHNTGISGEQAECLREMDSNTLCENQDMVTTSILDGGGALIEANHLKPAASEIKKLGETMNIIKIVVLPNTNNKTDFFCVKQIREAGIGNPMTGICHLEDSHQFVKSGSTGSRHSDVSYARSSAKDVAFFLLSSFLYSATS